MDLKGHKVAVIGAGPAGLYAVKQLSSQGASVSLLNRDIKPGGLAEYGIYHKKHKMKDGLRRQFRKILDQPDVHYFGNVALGKQADISFEELQGMGFTAVLFTVGAQKTRQLGLPGEGLDGVYHAKELVSHFNHLPPYSSQSYPMGERVAIVGVGAVMVDVANLAIYSAKAKEITAVARRSAADVKFSKKEFGSIYPYLEQSTFKLEIDRITSRMQTAGQDVDEATAFIHSTQNIKENISTDAKFNFRFLSQPVEIVGDADGKVAGLLIEDTIMKPGAGGKRISVVGTGNKTMLECDSVVFCIGNDHDPKLGLPLNSWNQYAAAPQPRFPIKGVSYESFDPKSGELLEGVFLAGWAREPNKGLVGNSRKDGINGATAVAQYLASLDPKPNAPNPVEALKKKLDDSSKVYINKETLMKIESVENMIARQNDLDHFKFRTNEDMLSAISMDLKEKVFD